MIELPGRFWVMDHLLKEFQKIRCYVEELFEEDFGFRLYLQKSVFNVEFHLLLRMANKLWLNDEQLRVVNSIYCYLPILSNQSKINKKHTDNLANALGIQLI